MVTVSDFGVIRTTDAENLVTRHLIHGKHVFLFEQHHYALLPWAELRGKLSRAPRLLTFDYHTDTHSAFLNHAYWQFGSNAHPTKKQWTPVAKKLVAAINFKDSATVRRAVSLLRYDEQIDTGLRSKILGLAFVVAFEDFGHITSNEQKRINKTKDKITSSTNADGETVYFMPTRKRATPPFTYTIPKNRIVVLPKAEINSGLQGDLRDRAYRDSALESQFLNDRIELIESICSSANVPTLFERPFILDLDLDYFNTRKSVAPADPSTFYDLIRRAEIITVARESSCVELCSLDGEELNSQFLESAVMTHIEAALSS
jgi:hypothetical protein